MDLEVIPEEEHEGGEENLEAKPQETPEAKPESEQEGIPMYNYNPYYVPEDELVEEPIEEERNEVLG